MSIAATRDEWKSLLGNLLEDLEQLVPIDGIVKDEDDFRDRFFALPAAQHADDPDNNYGYFNRIHDPVIYFISEIDGAISLKTPESLSDLFWTVAFVAIKVAFDEEWEFDDISEVYEDLNKAFPRDQPDLSSFPRDSQVQRCLQDIFEAYIGCYLILIKQLKNAGDDIDFGPVKEEIVRCAGVFEAKHREWSDKCNAARKELRDNVRSIDDSDTAETRWRSLRFLGRGTYGTVDEVEETGTGGLYARKCIPRRIPGADEKLIEKRVRNEAEIMMKLRHNHIASVNVFFRSDIFWSIIMTPVADCDLRTFLEEKCIGDGYPHENLRMIDQWFGCLISALAFAHEESIKHEDIKPSNVLIKEKKVFLTDFGTAKDFSELEASTTDSYNEQGTPIYWAPEPRAWGRPADVWALGCVFAEMLTVRQKKSLTEFKQWRFTPAKEYGYAFRSNPPKVKRWLKEKLNISSKDALAWTLVEQIFNMLIVNHLDRPEAKRIKRNLRIEDNLFCSSCA